MKFWELVKILKTGQNFRQFWCASYSPKFPGHHKWCKCVKCAASPAKNWSQKSVSHLRKSCALQMAVDTRCFTQAQLFAWFHVACVRYTPEYAMHPVIVTPFDHFLGGLGGDGQRGFGWRPNFFAFSTTFPKNNLKITKDPESMSKLVQKPQPNRADKFDKNGWAPLLNLLNENCSQFANNKNRRKKIYRLYVEYYFQAQIQTLWNRGNNDI